MSICAAPSTFLPRTIFPLPPSPFLSPYTKLTIPLPKQYLYIRHSNLYLLALTKRNTNCASILLFLHRLVAVFTEYFKTLEEESIRDNFVIIYELLDEMMDFGYPQTTESKILQEYITQESHKLEVQARPPIAVTNAVSWRSEGIRYRKNEVFLDVIESLNLLVSSTGNVLRSEILGAVKLKCYLSGMPELRLGLNDKVMFETTGRATRGKAVEMEDVKFHQCVRLSRFENDRTISFIPPDGEFELMSYRLNTQVKPLIWVESDVRMHSTSRMEYTLKVRSPLSQTRTWPDTHPTPSQNTQNPSSLNIPFSVHPKPFSSQSHITQALSPPHAQNSKTSHLQTLSDPCHSHLRLGRHAPNSNAGPRPTTSKSSSPSPKTPTRPASAPTSAPCITRPRNPPSSGKSSSSAGARSSSCAPNWACRR